MTATLSSPAIVIAPLAYYGSQNDGPENDLPVDLKERVVKALDIALYEWTKSESPVRILMAAGQHGYGQEDRTLAQKMCQHFKTIQEGCSRILPPIPLIVNETDQVHLLRPEIYWVMWLARQEFGTDPIRYKFVVPAEGAETVILVARQQLRQNEWVSVEADTKLSPSFWSWRSNNVTPFPGVQRQTALSG